MASFDADTGEIKTGNTVVGNIDGGFINPGGSTGTYGEGQIGFALDYVDGLKDALKKGAITFGDYFDLGEAAAKQATDIYRSIAGGGSNAATAANQYLGRLNKHFADPGVNNEFWARNAFTRREIAQLPNEALPTAEDIDSGLLPTEYLPRGIKTYEAPPPEEPTTPGIDDQQLTETGAPVTGVDPQTGIVTPEPGTELPPGAGIESLIGDPLRQSQQIEFEQQLIEDFGRRQEEQFRQMFQVQEQQRKQRLEDLGGFLQGEEERRFEEMVPDIQERLNTQGLLRSSALGESLAGERSKLEAETQAALLGQGLSDREAAIMATEQILGSRLSGQQAGLERRFSLEDIEREADLARELAAMGVSRIPSESGSGGFSLTGALGGGASGLATGLALAPITGGSSLALGSLMGLGGALSGGSGGGK